jgi:hypothetical protein
MASPVATLQHLHFIEFPKPARVDKDGDEWKLLLMVIS